MWFIFSIIIIALVPNVLGAEVGNKNLQEGIVPVPQGIVNDFLNGALQKLLEMLPDQLEIEHLYYLYPTGLFPKGYISVDHAKVKGIHGLNFTNTNIFVLTFQTDLSLPDLKIESEYAILVGLLDIVPIFGDGTIQTDFGNIVAHMSGKMILFPPHVEVSVEKLTLGNSTFSITGFYKNEKISEIISSILTSSIPKIFDKLSWTLVDIINDALNSILNPVPTSTTEDGGITSTQGSTARNSDTTATDSNTITSSTDSDSAHIDSTTITVESTTTGSSAKIVLNNFLFVVCILYYFH